DTGVPRPWASAPAASHFQPGLAARRGGYCFSTGKGTGPAPGARDTTCVIKFPPAPQTGPVMTAAPSGAGVKATRSGRYLAWGMMMVFAGGRVRPLTGDSGAVGTPDR